MSFGKRISAVAIVMTSVFGTTAWADGGVKVPSIVLEAYLQVMSNPNGHCGGSESGVVLAGSAKWDGQDYLFNECADDVSPSLQYPAWLTGRKSLPGSPEVIRQIAKSAAKYDLSLRITLENASVDKIPSGEGVIFGGTISKVEVVTASSRIQTMIDEVKNEQQACFKRPANGQDVDEICPKYRLQRLDGALNSLYRSVYQLSTLSGQNGAKKFAAIKKAESAWVAYKEAECAYEESNNPNPNKYGGRIYRACAIEKTEIRLKDLGDAADDLMALQQ